MPSSKVFILIKQNIFNNFMIFPSLIMEIDEQEHFVDSKNKPFSCFLSLSYEKNSFLINFHLNDTPGVIMCRMSTWQQCAALYLGAFQKKSIVSDNTKLLCFCVYEELYSALLKIRKSHISSIKWLEGNRQVCGHVIVGKFTDSTEKFSLLILERQIIT